MRCTGRADSFFNVTSKEYKVEFKTCRKIFTDCAHYYAISTEMMKFYRRMAQIRAADNGTLKTPITAQGLEETILNKFRVCGFDPEYCFQ